MNYWLSLYSKYGFLALEDSKPSVSLAPPDWEAEIVYSANRDLQERLTVAQRTVRFLGTFILALNLLLGAASVWLLLQPSPIRCERPLYGK